MIVMVDDDPAFVQFCREILEQEGFEVRTAFNADEAYRILKNPACRGMLIDMWMPGFNGAALLMLLAADGVKTPVIVFADDPSFEEDELKEFPNVRRLLRKPIYPEDLVAAVREFMPGG